MAVYKGTDKGDKSIKEEVEADKSIKKEGYEEVKVKIEDSGVETEETKEKSDDKGIDLLILITLT